MLKRLQGWYKGLPGFVRGLITAAGVLLMAPVLVTMMKLLLFPLMFIIIISISGITVNYPDTRALFLTAVMGASAPTLPPKPMVTAEASTEVNVLCSFILLLFRASAKRIFVTPWLMSSLTT